MEISRQDNQKGSTFVPDFPGSLFLNTSGLGFPSLKFIRVVKISPYKSNNWIGVTRTDSLNQEIRDIRAVLIYHQNLKTSTKKFGKRWVKVRARSFVSGVIRNTSERPE